MRLRRSLYQWACERLYGEFAWSYDQVAWLVSGGRWASWQRLALEHVVGPRVLEVGFGTGELLLEMAALGWSACGLEPSRSMQRVAAGKLRKTGQRIPVVRGRAQALPFSAGSFDSVVVTFPGPFVFEGETLQEFARVLRSGIPSPRGGISSRRSGSASPRSGVPSLRPPTKSGPVAGPATQLQAEPASAASRTGGGRLVVVGVSVALRNPVLRRVAPFFYGPLPAGWLRQAESALAAAGFALRVHNYQDPVLELPVLIAERILT